MNHQPIELSHVQNHADPFMIFIEVIDECDLACPTCIAASMPGSGNARSCTDLVSRVSRFAERNGPIKLLMITGGEPALHPDIITILTDLSRHASMLMLITNGVRIANDPSFAASLATIGPNFQVYLQFDSLRPESLVALRGRDFSDVRARAVAHLHSHNVPTTLICVVKRGVNDVDASDVVRFACGFDNIRGVTFQPIRASGRHADFDYL